MKNHCTLFPEIWRGRYIGDCCEKHDGNCDTSEFYNCLVKKIGKFHASYIAFGGFGGSIGCWIKYTKHMLTKDK